jgi:hypothetical protein
MAWREARGGALTGIKPTVPAAAYVSKTRACQSLCANLPKLWPLDNHEPRCKKAAEKKAGSRHEGEATSKGALGWARRPGLEVRSFALGYDMKVSLASPVLKS